MLYTKNDSASYIQQFKRKMTNFADKAPILLSFTTTPTGVQLINEHTDDVYEVAWDFSVPVKLFIFGIKQILRESNAYPIMTKVLSEVQEVPEAEQLQLATQGIPLEEIATKRTVRIEKKYLIDKIIVCRDIFIIEDLDTGTKYRYHMSKSSVFFLKKMRSGKLDSEQAAQYFFENSELMNEIIPREEEEENG